MAEQLLFDKLTYMDRLKRAGISEEHARAHAEAMEGALHEGVATSAEVTILGTALRAEMAALRTELRAEMAALRAEMRADMAALRSEMAAMQDKIIIRLGGLMVIGIGILIAMKVLGP
jgi:hypothetical protein